MYKYIHDVGARIVFQMTSEPMVIEQKDRQGNRVGWSANMEILITRSDNTPNGNRWKYATSEYPTQSFVARYTNENVISYFLMRHAPNGESISREQYAELQSQYEAIALGQSHE